jgi:FAD-linked oxidoreductase
MLSMKEKKLKWRNWSGEVTSYPSDIQCPTSVEEVVHLVKKCQHTGRKIRVVGSGHSFTPLVSTDEVMISLDYLTGIISMDKEKGIAEVWAGTKLKHLGEELYVYGFSQENLGDINKQSIAGAISTGTHGTGIEFGSIATQLVSITAVLANGEVVTCSEKENRSLFKAMQVSLGLLGIIVKVEIRVVPALHLVHESRRMSLSSCLDQLEVWKDNNRHFEFFWFPYTDKVQVKLMNEIKLVNTKRDRWNHCKKLVVENGLYWMVSEGCRLLPKMSKIVSRLSIKAVPDAVESGPSHRLFSTLRLVKFNEMEYSVPAKSLKAVILEMKEAMGNYSFDVHFPIECRYVKGDDILLSPAYGRDSAYIAVHMYKGMEYQGYFQKMEEIFQRYEGRPHWGKMHSFSYDNINKSYPMFAEFLLLQNQMDPDAMFVNDYLRGIFRI